MKTRKSPPSLVGESGGSQDNRDCSCVVNDAGNRSRNQAEKTADFVGPFSPGGVPTGCEARPEAEAGERLAAAASGLGPLPCLNSNNSTESYEETFEKLFSAVEEYTQHCDDKEGEIARGERTRDGRSIETYKSGKVIFGGMSQAEKRGAYALTLNVAHLAKVHGIERLGFLTLTFRENLEDPREAQRRYNSLATHVLRKHFADYVGVTELQKRGAVHFHLLVVCHEDIRTGVSFSELAEGCYASAGPYLRGLWASLREAMPRYGFGRSELTPIRTTAQAIAGYVGEYLNKASAYRPQHLKGTRLVRYSSGWRVARQSFAWHSPGASIWRQRVAAFAAATGCKTFSDLTRRHGRRWASKLAAICFAADFGGVDFDAALEAIAWADKRTV